MEFEGNRSEDALFGFLFSVVTRLLTDIHVTTMKFLSFVNRSFICHI